MRELQQAVAAAFENVVASGVIEKTIEAKLTETVNNLITEQLRSYSDFGKQLSEAVKAVMQVDFSTLGLPGYNDLILKIVRAQVDKHTSSVVAAQVEQQMSELLAPAPAEIKLSELIKKFIERHQESHSCSCDAPEYMTLHIGDSRHNSRWIAMDEDPHKSEYECDIRFAVSLDDGRIFGLRLRNAEVEKTLFVGSLYGFERNLFQMVASGTKLIIDGADADDFETSYSNRD